jgi:hypothetical protein
LGGTFFEGGFSLAVVTHLPVWVKKSPKSRNSKKKQLGVAFKAENDIGKILNMNTVDLQRTKYENSGVFQDRCPVCDLVHTTHRRDIVSTFVVAHKNNNSNASAFAKHVINGYSMGKIDDFLDVVYITRKGKQLDGME